MNTHKTTRDRTMRTIDIISIFSLRSAWRLIRGIARSPFEPDYAGSPLAVCWFTNFTCNANCHFCCKAQEIHRGNDRFPPLGLEKSKELLEKIRHKVDLLYLSGGEPTLNPDILDILKETKALHFQSVGISTNLISIDKNPEILEYIDVIGISLHAPETERHAKELGVSAKVGEHIFSNLDMVTDYSTRNDIRILINCVINPDNLDSIPDMVEFTRKRGFLLELVPANNNGRMPSGLYNNPAYASLIDNLLQLRKSGQADHLAGSTHYYKTIRDFIPFRCFPYGVPNIMPDGSLCTPCDVSKQYAVNVTDYKDIKAAVKASLPFLGNYPCSEGKCFKAGIIERSRLFNLLLQDLELDF